MKSNFLKIFSFALLFLSVAFLIKAEEKLQIYLPQISIVEMIENANHFLFIVAVLLSTVIILIAGFSFLTSSGNPKKRDKAKKIIIFALIGLFFVLFSRGLVALIKEFFK
jgi:hypothetical protein